MIKLKELFRYIDERLILKEIFRKIIGERLYLHYFYTFFLSGQVASLETDEAVPLFI